MGGGDFVAETLRQEENLEIAGLSAQRLPTKMQSENWFKQWFSFSLADEFFEPISCVAVKQSRDRAQEGQTVRESQSVQSLTLVSDSTRLGLSLLASLKQFLVL